MTKRTSVMPVLLLSAMLAAMAWLAGAEGSRRAIADSGLALRIAPKGEAVPGWIQDGYDYPYLLPTRPPAAPVVPSLLATAAVLTGWWAFSASVSYASARSKLGTLSLRRLKSILLRRAARRACIVSLVVSAACFAIFWWAWLIISLMLEDLRGAVIYGQNPTPRPVIVFVPKAVNDHPASIAMMLVGWVLLSAAIARVLVLRSCRPDLARLRSACPSCGYKLRSSPAAVCPECGPPVALLRRPFHWRLAIGMGRRRPIHDLVGPRVVRVFAWTALVILATSPISLMLLMDWFGVLRVFRSGVYKLYGQADVAILRLLGLHP